MILEVCANSYESAINAEKGGAHRIELCENLSVGGLTPNFDLAKKVISELNIPVFHESQEFELNGKLFLIGHGDGLGPGDIGYKRMKKVFTFPFFKWLFRWLHPDLGVRLGQYISVKNKLISGDDDAKFLGEENEWLVQYCKRKLEEKYYDYFVFGHRHLPLEIDLDNKSKYINLGDWIQYFTYGEFMKTFKLKEF